MMSSATSVKGQGVGSAYIEQVGLVSSELSDKFEVTINKRIKADITHYHTINFGYYLSMKSLTSRGKSVGYVHMLPETVETSVNLPRFMKQIFYKYMNTCFPYGIYIFPANR